MFDVGFLFMIAVIGLITWTDLSQVMEARRTGVVRSRGVPISRSESPTAYWATYSWRFFHMCVGVAVLLACIGAWSLQPVRQWMLHLVGVPR